MVKIRSGADIQMGTILYDMRGYSMTYYDFYKVVKITDKSCVLQKLKKKVVHGGGFNPDVEPTNEFDTKEKPIRKRFDCLHMWEWKPGTVCSENYLD